MLSNINNLNDIIINRLDEPLEDLEREANNSTIMMRRKSTFGMGNPMNISARTRSRTKPTSKMLPLIEDTINTTQLLHIKLTQLQA